MTLPIIVEINNLTQVFVGPNQSAGSSKVYLSSLVISYFFSFQVFLLEISQLSDSKEYKGLYWACLEETKDSSRKF